ncbi:hypothetical protein NIES22_70810 (plasmid) [Calothrix brevissima NIES-22]|nr:hypothetical protein NIES22_70810 [Calothrix brevissima NIES-22]
MVEASVPKVLSGVICALAGVLASINREGMKNFLKKFWFSGIYDYLKRFIDALSYGIRYITISA